MKTLLNLFWLAIGLCLSVSAGHAQDPQYPPGKYDQHAVDKYREFLNNNKGLALSKTREVLEIVRLLNKHKIPVYPWKHQVNILKVEGPFLNNPTCRGTSAGYGPVMRITPGYQYPEKVTDLYVFGFFRGSIHFVGGGLNETPYIGGNVFAGKIRGNESFCYANTTFGLWSIETRREFLVPQPGFPQWNGDEVYMVVADHFRKAPDGVHARFQQMFENLTNL